MIKYNVYQLYNTLLSSFDWQSLGPFTTQANSPEANLLAAIGPLSYFVDVDLQNKSLQEELSKEEFFQLMLIIGKIIQTNDERFKAVISAWLKEHFGKNGSNFLESFIANDLLDENLFELALQSREDKNLQCYFLSRVLDELIDVFNQYSLKTQYPELFAVITKNLVKFLTRGTLPLLFDIMEILRSNDFWGEQHVQALTLYLQKQIHESPYIAINSLKGCLVRLSKLDKLNAEMTLLVLQKNQEEGLLDVAKKIKGLDNNIKWKLTEFNYYLPGVYDCLVYLLYQDLVDQQILEYMQAAQSHASILDKLFDAALKSGLKLGQETIKKIILTGEQGYKFLEPFIANDLLDENLIELALQSREDKNLQCYFHSRVWSELIDVFNQYSLKTQYPELFAVITKNIVKILSYGALPVLFDIMEILQKNGFWDKQHAQVLTLYLQKQIHGHPFMAMNSLKACLVRVSKVGKLNAEVALQILQKNQAEDLIDLAKKFKDLDTDIRWELAKFKCHLPDVYDCLVYLLYQDLVSVHILYYLQDRQNFASVLNGVFDNILASGLKPDKETIEKIILLSDVPELENIVNQFNQQSRPVAYNPRFHSGKTKDDYFKDFIEMKYKSYSSSQGLHYRGGHYYR
jgi:hypothetical protein